MFAEELEVSDETGISMVKVVEKSNMSEDEEITFKTLFDTTKFSMTPSINEKI